MRLLVDGGDFGVRQMRAVGEDRAGNVEQARVFELLDEAAAEPLAGDLCVDRVFGRVDVNTDAHAMGEFHTIDERFFVERETGVSANECRESAIGPQLAFFDVAFVFVEPLPPFAGAVAVGDFITQHTAAADRGDAVFERREAAVDRVGRGVVVDERGRAAAERGERADLAADFDAFERVGPIEPPPDELQNLVEVFGRPRRGRHPGGQRGIQMRVAVHQAGHEHRAATIDDLIAGRRGGIFADVNNLSTGNAQIAAFDPRRIELNKQCVAKKSGHAGVFTTETQRAWRRAAE